MGWFGEKSQSSVVNSTRSAPAASGRLADKSSSDPANRPRAKSRGYQPPAGSIQNLRPPSQTQQTKHQEPPKERAKTVPDQVPKEEKDEDKAMVVPPVEMKESKDASSADSHEEDRSYDHVLEEGTAHQSHLNSLFNGHLMKWKFEAEEGTLFLRLPAFLGSLALLGCTVAAYFFDIENAIEPHSIVMYVCIVTMAILILILDGRFLSSHPLSIRSHLRNITTRNFNILRFVWGRGLLYLTVGVLMIGQMWLYDIYAGSFMCFIGVLAVAVGVHASRKFATLRNSLADESFLLLVFANYDNDGDGYVSPREFSMILMDLGVELDDRYTLKAFNAIDHEGHRRISFEEFSHWWSSGFVERGRKHWSEDGDDEPSYRRMGNRSPDV